MLESLRGGCFGARAMRISPTLTLARIVIVAVLAGTSLAIAAANTPPLPAPQQIDIPVSSGILHAYLYRPEGAGPFPVVIAAHGCGGLPGRSSPVQSHYRDWADQLMKAGHAVLLPDSYGSRDLGPQCRVKESAIRASHERAADIMASRQWLAQQSWVIKGRIGLLGWGDGASALLWAVRPQPASRKADIDFRAAIAFYPDCRSPSGLGWSARMPTLVLIGAADDIGSPAACRQMIDGARSRSALAQIVVYPGAYQGFDRQNVPLRAVAGFGDADLPDRGHVGSDLKARADAQKRVVKWLAR